jgi:hypothetical protein
MSLPEFSETNQLNRMRQVLTTGDLETLSSRHRFARG